MDQILFLKTKEELKIEARASGLFRALPEDLQKFEREVGSLEHTPSSEKIVVYLKSLFGDLNKETSQTIANIKQAFAEQ